MSIHESIDDVCFIEVFVEFLLDRLTGLARILVPFFPRKMLVLVAGAFSDLLRFVAFDI